MTAKKPAATKYETQKLAPASDPGLAEYAKSIVGGIVAGLTALGTALADGHVTAVEAVGVLLAAVIAGYAVWRVPNADPAEKAPAAKP